MLVNTVGTDLSIETFGFKIRNSSEVLRGHVLAEISNLKKFSLSNLGKICTNDVQVEVRASEISIIAIVHCSTRAMIRVDPQQMMSIIMKPDACALAVHRESN